MTAMCGLGEFLHVPVWNWIHWTNVKSRYIMVYSLIILYSYCLFIVIIMIGKGSIHYYHNRLYIEQLMLVAML